MSANTTVTSDGASREHRRPLTSSSPEINHVRPVSLPASIDKFLRFAKVINMGSGEFLGELECLTLCAVLAVREQAYGISIQQQLEEVGRKLSFSTIYATLDRLEKKGYVSSWLGDPTPERGGKPKRCFRIEGSGMAALARSRAVMESMWAAAQPNWGNI